MEALKTHLLSAKIMLVLYACFPENDQNCLKKTKKKPVVDIRGILKSTNVFEYCLKKSKTKKNHEPMKKNSNSKKKNHEPMKKISKSKKKKNMTTCKQKASKK